PSRSGDDRDCWTPGAVRSNANQHASASEVATRSPEGMDHAPERDSSKRPAKQRHIKGSTRPREALDRAQAKVDVGRAARTLLEKGLVNTGAIRVDRQDR